MSRSWLGKVVEKGVSGEGVIGVIVRRRESVEYVGGVVNLERVVGY